MARLRVYELARQLDLRNKDLLERLRSIGMPAESHMSALTDQQVAAIPGTQNLSNCSEPKPQRGIVRRSRRTIQRQVPATPAIQRGPIVAHSRDFRLLQALSISETKAEAALRAAKTQQDMLLRALKDFQDTVKASKIKMPADRSATIEAANRSFETQYDNLRETLDRLAENSSAELSQAFSSLERDVRYVTIMLFGRTKAGKSTTMEALTGGDGSTIGKGKQHTTTNVKAYYYPNNASGVEPDYPCMRILDTPGIEGFMGEELAAMAEKYVEKADHIFFLLTDDKATSGELERFGSIRTQGKGITVLLNVKSSDEDLDLLLESPQHIFKADEIGGHTRRITGYLSSHFDMPAPPIIPFHARSAWLSRANQKLPETIQSREGLETASRISEVESRIVNFITEEAIYARIRTPRDLIYSHIWSLKDELRPFAGQFKAMMKQIGGATESLERGVERARRKIVDRYSLLNSRFQAASDGIPGLVDEIISAGGFRRKLNERWREFLRGHGVHDCVERFVEAGRQDFDMEIKEEARAVAADFDASRIDDLNGIFDEYHRKEESTGKNKYARVAIRTGAAAGVPVLVSWAVANWWNPTGWLAVAAAAAVTVAAGFGAEAGARAATDEWERSDKRKLHSHRADTIRKLKERIWSDHDTAKSCCDDWLEKTKRFYLNTFKEAACAIEEASKILWQGAVSSLKALDDVARLSDDALVKDVLDHIVPEVVSGAVKIVKVARCPKITTKILLDADHDRINILATCIGPKGARIRKIASALCGEEVSLVDGRADLKVQILQALGLFKLDPEAVVVNGDGLIKTAKVDVRGGLAGHIIGKSGWNIRLASQLLNIKIEIQERV